MLLDSTNARENPAAVRAERGLRLGLARTNMDAELLALLCPDWRNAMLVLDADTMTVAYANIAALELLKQRQIMLVNRGALEVSSRHDSQRLQETLARALAEDIGISSVVIDDATHGLTYCLRICVPQGFLRDVMDRRLQNTGRLVVLEVTSARMVPSNSDLRALGEAFGLTLAETSILALLGQGRSLGEISRLRGVGIETVRHQCKRLLEKTRSRRQSDLVKLVVGLCGQDVFAAQG